MFWKVRRLRQSTTTALGALSLMVATMGVAASSAHAEEQGNSQDAKACQKEGWANLARSEDPTIPFSSGGECVSYGAQGGTIVPHTPEGDARRICEDAGGVFQTGGSDLWQCTDFSIGQPMETAVDTARALDAACSDDGGRPWSVIHAAETVDGSTHRCQPL